VERVEGNATAYSASFSSFVVSLVDNLIISLTTFVSYMSFDYVFLKNLVWAPSCVALALLSPRVFPHVGKEGPTSNGTIVSFVFKKKKIKKIIQHQVLGYVTVI